MTVREARTFGENRLSGISGDERGTDAMVLLCQALNTDRSRLLAMQDETLTDQAFSDFTALLDKRRSGWPCAYLTGHKEFFSLDFLVYTRVLIPRPDT